MIVLHDVAYLIVAITGLIGTLTAAYNAFIKSKQKNHDEEKQDAELYRRRWLDAEKGNDKLRREIKDLEKEKNKDDN